MKSRITYEVCYRKILTEEFVPFPAWNGEKNWYANIADALDEMKRLATHHTAWHFTIYRTEPIV